LPTTRTRSAFHVGEALAEALEALAARGRSIRGSAALLVEPGRSRTVFAQAVDDDSWPCEYRATTM